MSRICKGAIMQGISLKLSHKFLYLPLGLKRVSLKNFYINYQKS